VNIPDSYIAHMSLWSDSSVIGTIKQSDLGTEQDTRGRGTTGQTQDNSAGRFIYDAHTLNVRLA